ncbi:SDR family NAD(P)-dependent oxidoreductase [Fulvivirga sediminis]|uniref:SDR family oxidoreductase n=1 Tax=Fulvivirga sediminis TaxID=2803949 RepID=A0A937JYZ1_9BACT|nr:SDR family oxidoreductase [Fulvivirga sediminis]MBL3654730.1 SDR family oxidoreductase [Fulvivirga sediminis]
MDLNLKEKVALVTGASKGIGKGIAEELAKEGCHLIICARDQVDLSQVVSELEKYNVDVLAVPTDLTDEQQIDNLIHKSQERFGKIDILVNNAGTIGDPLSFMELSTQQWRDIFELNVFSAVTLIRKVVPMMQHNKWGRIINISSENGEQPDPDMAHYNVTKGALNNLTKTLSKVLAKDGILVNTVSPAFIKTPLVESMMQDIADKEGITPDEAVQAFLKNKRPNLVLERAGDVEETASVVTFLASDKASFVTGANFRVDGGSVASV